VVWYDVSDISKRPAAAFFTVTLQINVVLPSQRSVNLRDSTVQTSHMTGIFVIIENHEFYIWTAFVTISLAEIRM
jgi:hypothetical protein